MPDQARFLEYFVAQGITTLVVGNCGYAPAPINPLTAPLMQAYTAFIKPRDLDWQWRTFGDYLDYLDGHGRLHSGLIRLRGHRGGLSSSLGNLIGFEGLCSRKFFSCHL